MKLVLSGLRVQPHWLQWTLRSSREHGLGLHGLVGLANGRCWQELKGQEGRKARESVPSAPPCWAVGWCGCHPLSPPVTPGGVPFC